MSRLKAITTRYKGYRFRSRLEARWAVFLDGMKFEWEYEPQGFELGGGERYLPDFLLRVGETRVWLEVKPERPAAGDKVFAFAASIDESVFVGAGLPLDKNMLSRGSCGIYRVGGSVDTWPDMGNLWPCDWIQCPFCESMSACMDGAIIDPWCSCLCALESLCRALCSAETEPGALRLVDASFFLSHGLHDLARNRLALAVESAKAARFEFGECGAPAAEARRG